MIRSSSNAFAALACFLLLLLVGLEVQRVKNAAECEGSPPVVTPTK